MIFFSGHHWLSAAERQHHLGALLEADPLLLVTHVQLGRDRVQDLGSV
jgi:hypothetical protein